MTITDLDKLTSGWSIARNKESTQTVGYVWMERRFNINTKETYDVGYKIEKNLKVYVYRHAINLSEYTGALGAWTEFTV